MFQEAVRYIDQNSMSHSLFEDSSETGGSSGRYKKKGEKLMLA